MTDLTFTETSKKAIIALLIRLKLADGEEAPEEIRYIMRVAKKFQLSDEDVFDIEDNLDQYPLEPPHNERSRMTILYYMLFFIKSDGIIDETEERMLQEFAFKLGFRTELTRNLISVLHQYASDTVPPEQMLIKIKPYMN